MSTTTTAFTAQPYPNPTPSRLFTYSINHGGMTRQYQIYMPASLKNVSSRPVILMLHGGQGNPNKVIGCTSILYPAESEGFVVCFPMTDGRPWSDGRPETAGYDDVGYVKAVIEEIIAKQSVNRSRVFVCGMSSGGMMAQRLVLDSASTFAGMASAIANLPVALQSAKPSVKLPVSLWFAADDPLMPPEGGTIKSWEKGQVISRQATIDFWKARSSSLESYVVPGGHDWPVGATDGIVKFLSPYGL